MSRLPLVWGDHTGKTFCCFCCLQELFHSHLVFASHTSGPLWCWITILLFFFNFFEILSTWLPHRTFSFGPVWPCFFPVIFCLWFWLVWYFRFLAYWALSFGPVWPCFFPVVFCLWFWLVWCFGFLADWALSLGPIWPCLFPVVRLCRCGCGRVFLP